MRVDRARQRPIMGHAIGARGVHRHAVGDRRSPGGVGAGVEIGGEVHRRETPVARRPILATMRAGCRLVVVMIDSRRE